MKKFCNLALKKTKTMSQITEVSTALFGYLKRPSLYPELGRKIWKNIFNRSSATKGKIEALEWCEKIAISEQYFIENVLKMKHIPFEIQFKEDFEFGKNAQNQSPVKMGGAGSLNVLYGINEYTKSLNTIETGVAYGWSSLACLASLAKRGGTLYSSDMPYIMQTHSSDFVGCVIPEKYKKYWKLFRFADKESLPKIFNEQSSFDVVHYDSDKTYDGRLWAYKLLFEKLRSGGVFMSDDIADNSAFKDFCEKNEFVPYVIGFDKKYAGIIIK